MLIHPSFSTDIISCFIREHNYLSNYGAKKFTSRHRTSEDQKIIFQVKTVIHNIYSGQLPSLEGGFGATVCYHYCSYYA